MPCISPCDLCPRRCGADRTHTPGFCGAPAAPKAARAALHFWEEPPISGTKGSGTVFFSGCNLRCSFCQNDALSRRGFGKEITPTRLAEIFLSLKAQGAHNINLVTPTPYLPQIKEAAALLPADFGLPFVYNCGGYETPEAVREAASFCRIFLTDLKFFDPALSKAVCGVSDYFAFALPAAAEMVRLCGAPRIDADGILQSGVIVRHLVLPGHTDDSFRLLAALLDALPKDRFILSLMRQYTPPAAPPPDFPKELRRRLTTYEYQKVVRFLEERQVTSAFLQAAESADGSFTPAWDLTGL